MNRVFTIALLALVLGAGCSNSAGPDSDACASLQEERAGVEASVSKLEGVLDSMPADAIRYAVQTEEELALFSLYFAEVNAGIESAHDQYEVACKWPMIEAGDFDGVFDTVYRPHVEVLGRQRRAVLDVANALEAAGPSEVVGDAVEAYRGVAEQLKQGLALQLKVCEDDFDAETCGPFKDAIRKAVADGSASAKPVLVEENTDEKSD